MLNCTRTGKEEKVLSSEFLPGLKNGPHPGSGGGGGLVGEVDFSYIIKS
ncbi:hypothetical protein LEP1GSC192_3690 [Leptospira sp. B5-022]|nr:hypothetical protein LEP1GSC192_3690 [Leptospira sp. B5-022]